MSTTPVLGVVMDSIANISVAKDSTFAMLLEAQRRGWTLRYMEQGDLSLRDGRAWGRWRSLRVFDDGVHWYELGEVRESPLDEQRVILLRKDPPFDMDYVYTTYLLEFAEAAGSLVVNRPGSVRDVNEKLYTAWFPQCCVPSLVSSEPEALRAFVAEQGEAVVKPLDLMGGQSIFRLSPADPNLNVILETVTHSGRRLVMAQRFIPEIRAGDKRILLIDGEPVPHALARVPPAGEFRGNLAAGGRGQGMALGERERWICSQVGPVLRDKGLLFVGLDVIGDYLTEINVTSPTCIRELDRMYGLNIAGSLFDAIDKRLNT